MRLKGIRYAVAAWVLLLAFHIADPVSSAFAQNQAQWTAQNQAQSANPGIVPGMPTFPRQMIPTLPGLPPGGDQSQLPPVFDQRSLADLPGQSRGTERVGSPTQAEGGPTLVTPLGDLQRASGPATAVFGGALFTGQPQSSSDAPNPNYVLAPGDRVSVRAWGAVDAEQVSQIDPAGNLFLPNIGPIRVAGTRVGDLQRVVEGEIRRVYTQQVQVYATVLSTQRIGVFVAGFVKSPGRYAGSASDSILDFLLRAGGVDPARGSFRKISVQRGGAIVTSVDLYRFLMDGQIPQVRLQEGETIVVGRHRPLVGADGKQVERRLEFNVALGDASNLDRFDAMEARAMGVPNNVAMNRANLPLQQRAWQAASIAQRFAVKPSPAVVPEVLAPEANSNPPTDPPTDRTP